MKFAVVAKHRSILPVPWMCSAFDVCRSVFHVWLVGPAS